MAARAIRTLALLLVLVAGVLAAARPAHAGPCSRGDHMQVRGLGCTLYLFLVVPSLVMPEAIVRVAPGAGEDAWDGGLLWEAPVTFGPARVAHTVSPGVAVYLASGEVQGRLDYRLRLWPGPDVSLVERRVLLMGAVGAFAGNEGAGVRGGARFVLGLPAVGLFVEPGASWDLVRARFAAELTAGLQVSILP